MPELQGRFTKQTVGTATFKSFASNTIQDIYSMKKATLFLLILFTVATTLRARDCEMFLSSCPENFNGRTIYVPPNITALHSKVFSCDIYNIVEGISNSKEPPSIVFIIDHSYSMMGLGNTYPGNDIYGSRFNVTRDLIDTVYAKYPNAEIGLVVFREVLYLDHRNNSFLRQLTGQGDESYLPLMQLDKKYTGNQSGLNVLKTLLQTDTVVRYSEKNKINVECSDLIYKPEFSTVGNTNINNAFGAALEAMSFSVNPKNRRFFIFLSDGEPHPLNDNSQHGGKDPFYFSEGIETPTTFTVYLNNTETTAPASLLTMTNNIKQNNYSSSNAVSDIWLLKTNYDALMALCMNNIMKPILSVTTGNPVTMTVNATSSNNIVDSCFIFPRSFPLNNESTDFNIKVYYQLKNSITSLQRDTLTNIKFKVIRKPGAELPEDVSEICDQAKSLAFYYNGIKINSADKSMENIEVRLESDIPLKNPVNVDISETANQVKDHFIIELKQNSTYWNNSFIRVTGESATTDKTLQTQIKDSIIATYRNGVDNSQTIRISIPFNENTDNSEKAVSYSLVPGAMNNPCTENSLVPQTIRNEYASAKRLDAFKEKGMVLMTVPANSSENNIALSGTVSIYDVLKNIIIENQPLVINNNKSFYIWDLTNKNHRKVASGTYLAVFTISDRYGGKNTYRLRIGVKR